MPLPQTNTQTTHQGIDQRTKRPTSLISQGKLISYSYDVHGNIKTKTETPIDKQGNEIAQSQNGLVGYRKSIQFAYHPNNELKQTITIIDTGLEVTKTTTNYFYDAFGRRIAKHSKIERLNKLNQKGALVRYPTTLLHLSKTQKTEHQTTLMLWEGNRQIQEYTDHHIFTTVYDDQSFEPVSRLVQSRDKDCDDLKIYHYHNNHLGTPQELTDENGEVVWANYEFAWGGSYQSYYKEKSLNNCAILEHELQPIRFQGQSLDVETGLHYNRFRYYDSDVGMFISRDPIGLLGGNNVFAYAPNPIHWVDPLGLNKTPTKDCCKKDECKGLTEPTLPSGTIVSSGSIKVEHYYTTNDHPPAHMHIVGGGKTTRIGINGKPLKGDPPLSKEQQKLVNDNLSKIRRAGKKIGKWLEYKEKCG